MSAGRYANPVQALHIKFIHILIELVERAHVEKTTRRPNSKPRCIDSAME